MVKNTETKIIPKVLFGLIGGSGTFSLNYPEDMQQKDIVVLAEDLIFDTPFGESPSFKHFKIGEKEVLTLKMHGWRPGVTRADASRQVFWVFKEAGVRHILAEGGVGSINHLLKPRDVIICNDYIDFSLRKDVSLGSTDLLIMRQAICPRLHRALVEASEKAGIKRIFDRGNYVVTDGRHFESPAEVVMFGRLGGDVVGQSMCPEVYLAREIGACYARVDLVVNYAEGVIKDWAHEELKAIFYGEAKTMGQILLDALRIIGPGQDCACTDLRKETLLK